MRQGDVQAARSAVVAAEKALDLARAELRVVELHVHPLTGELLADDAAALREAVADADADLTRRYVGARRTLLTVF